jgi:hypothetical protein
MVQQVLKDLGFFDGHTPGMAKIWLEMNNLKKHMFSLWDPVFSLHAPMATHLETMRDGRACTSRGGHTRLGRGVAQVKGGYAWVRGRRAWKGGDAHG